MLAELKVTARKWARKWFDFRYEYYSTLLDDPTQSITASPEPIERELRYGATELQASARQAREYGVEFGNGEGFTQLAIDIQGLAEEIESWIRAPHVAEYIAYDPEHYAGETGLVFDTRTHQWVPREE